MPSPSTQKQILSLPFRSGLSQKEDPRWLAPGSQLVAQNAEHPKTNVLGKRVGFTSLSTGAIYPNGVSTVLQGGKRLGTVDGKLFQIAPDVWTDSAWNFDEESQQWVFADRVPEVYVLPDRTVAGFNDVIREYDTAICNGYAVHVYMSNPYQEGSQYTDSSYTPQVYFSVENAETGQVITPPTLLPGPTNQNGFSFVAAPKLIALGNGASNPTVTLGYIAALSENPDLSIGLYLRTMNMLTPWTGWSSATIISGLSVPTDLFGNQLTAISTALIHELGTWDIATSTDNNSTTYAVAYQIDSESREIALSICEATSPPKVTVTENCSPADQGYVSDGSPYLNAIGLDVNGVFIDDGLIGLSYAYNVLQSGTVFTRVKVQARLWSDFPSSYSTAVDLIATAPGPYLATGSNYPHTIAIATGAEQGIYRVAFSPCDARWDPTYTEGPAAGTSAGNGSFIGAWSVQANSGVAMTVASGPQPSWTWGVVTASRFIPNVNGIGYIIARLVSDEQGTHYLLADDAWKDAASSGNPSMRLVSTFAPRLSSTVFPTYSVFYQSANQWVWQDRSLPRTLGHVVPNPQADGNNVYQGLISVALGPQSQNPTLEQFDFDSDLSYQNAELGYTTGIATGCPSLSDGYHVHEFAFPYYPAVFGALVNSFEVGSPGQPEFGQGLTSGSVYNYIAIFDWVDDAGQLHRSGRSAAVSVNTTTTWQGNPIPPPSWVASVTLNVTCLGFTGKAKGLSLNGAGPEKPTSVTPMVRLFRTQANGSLYYEVGSQLAQNGTNAISFTDNLGDSQIADNDLLYGDGLDGEVQGSILDNLTPPAFQCLCVHKNRIFGVDGTNVWATKELVNGEGAGFNELSAFSWNDNSDPITAIASLDDKLVLFKRNDVGIVTGEGPEDDGSQNDWSPVQRVATDLGAIDWRGVVVKSDGIYFMSDAGLRMLTRDLQVVPVPDVEDVLTTYPNVTAAVVHPNAGKICLQASNDNGQGVRVDHNYVLECWTTAETVSNDGSAVGAVSAVVADAPQSGSLAATYHWLASDGTVHRETSSTYLDGSTFVPMQIETAWIKAGGIENFARFRRLQVVWDGDDPHQLSVYVAFDYSDTYYLMGTVTWAMMQAMTTPLYQQLFSLPRQRAEAVRFKIVDSADSKVQPVTGQGPVLISMGLEIATYTNSRTNRLPAAQRS